MNEDAFKDGGSSPPNFLKLSSCLSRYCHIPLDIKPLVDKLSHQFLDGGPFLGLGVFKIAGDLAYYTAHQVNQGMIVALASPEGGSIRAYERSSEVAVREEVMQ